MPTFISITSPKLLDNTQVLASQTLTSACVRCPTMSGVDASLNLALIRHLISLTSYILYLVFSYKEL